MVKEGPAPVDEHAQARRSKMRLHAPQGVCRIVSVFFALIAISLTSFSLPAQALDLKIDGRSKVSLQLKWKHQFQFAGYYMAKKLGYYADEGLEVEIREATPGLDPFYEVTEERADFGVGNSDLLLLRDKGHPVVVLGAIFQHSPIAIMVSANGPVKNIHQLASANLMIEPHSAEILATFVEEGIDINKLNIVEHTFNVGQLVTGAVDAMSIYTTDEPYTMDLTEEEYLLLRPITSGVDFYGDNLFTNGHMITDHPEQVQGFWRASKKGWEYALSHLEETVDVILNDYNTIKGRDHLLYEAKHTRDLVLPDIVEIGYMNRSRWNTILDTYKSLGFVSKDLDLSGFLYAEKQPPLPSWFWDAVTAGLLALGAGAIALAYQARMNAQLRQKEAKLSEANHHKEMLLSIIGHDLKNPIYAIRNYGNKIALNPDAITPKDLTQYVQMISFGIDTAVGVLDNLQQWAVLQSDDIDTENKHVDLQPIVARNLDLFRIQAETEGIRITASGFEQIKVLGNEWRIDTVLRNLINHAYKNTPRNGTIRLSVQSSDDFHDIIVEDSGEGVSGDTFSIFKLPDGQALMNANETGSGFGLPLCKQLVELHGGELSLESNPTGGLKVTLRLMRG